jgi:hypothetical protein
MAEKSILDGIKVEEEGFPLNKPYQKSLTTIGIISSCPKCGAPIYGKRYAEVNEDAPEPKFTCNCRVQVKDIKDTMHTK